MFATTALLAGALVTGSLMPAATPQADVRIRVYDGYGFAAGDLAASSREAAALLKRAGVVVGWHNCTGATLLDENCARPLDACEVVIRIAAAPPHTTPYTLGSSLIDRRERFGTLATVFGDRVNGLAEAAEMNVGTLLGRVIAHELVHLLLGTSGHSGRGLMRARWDEAELRRNLSADWTLSTREVRDVRRNLAARARQRDLEAKARPEDGSRLGQQ